MGNRPKRIPRPFVPDRHEFNPRKAGLTGWQRINGAWRYDERNDRVEVEYVGNRGRETRTVYISVYFWGQISGARRPAGDWYLLEHIYSAGAIPHRAVCDILEANGFGQSIKVQGQ